MFTYAFILILTVHLCKGTAILPDLRVVTCSIDPFRHINSPVIKWSSNGQIANPNDATKTKLVINKGVQMTFECSAGTVTFPDYTTQTSKSVSATCSTNKKFVIGGKTVTWQDITCVETYSKLTGATCGDNGVGQLAVIGYYGSNNVFTKAIEVCYNMMTQSPIYSHYNLLFSTASKATYLSPGWVQDVGFYALDAGTVVNSLYSQSATIITSLLGGKKYDYGLTRGHLAGNADFLYSIEQEATYHYINAAPQWDDLNSGGWGRLEELIREYADDKSTNLEIWTGVDGIATLLDANNKATQLYLYTNINTKALPVPKIFWKVVYDKTNNKAVAFVGINERLGRTLTNDDLICQDQWTSVTWVSKSWAASSRKTDGEHSFVYACKVEDLPNTIFNSVDVLGNTVALLN